MSHAPIEQVLQHMEEGARLVHGTEPERLKGGYSEAEVYYLQVEGGNQTPRSIGGHRILKISQLRHDIADEEVRYKSCLEHSREFMTRFAPPLHRASYQSGGWSYLLFAPANTIGDGITLPLSPVDERLGPMLGRVAARLLCGIVPDDALAFNRKPERQRRKVGALLDEWLPNHHIGNGDPRAWVQALREHQRYDDLFLAGGYNFNDAIHTTSLKQFRDKQISFYHGWIHGDLHLGNILCRPLASSKVLNMDEFWIIDFAMARRAPLLYDHAYLILSILCSLEDIPDESVIRLLRQEELIGYPHAESAKKAYAAIIDSTVEWAKIYPAYGRDILAQWRLALLAAGLNWARKKYGEADISKALRAYLVASFAADQFVKHVHLTPPEQRQIASSRIPSERSQVASEIDRLRTLPSFPGTSLSGFLVLNALFSSGFTWAQLQDRMRPVGFWKLRNGRKLSAPEIRELQHIADATRLLANSRNLARMLECEDTGKVGLDERLALIGQTGWPANIKVRQLIEEKRRFLLVGWLSPNVKERLKEVANWGDQPISKRTWYLKKAYYHAGIRLTADHMAAAAIADFSDTRWQIFINREPPEGLPHLRLANKTIGSLVAQRLFPAGAELSDRRISIIEGGVGGGHTTYYVLKELSERNTCGAIEYMGMELVPALSEELNAMLVGSTGEGDRERLFNSLRLKDKLRFLRRDKRMVVTGRMEDVICDLWDECRPEPPTGEQIAIDVFFTSFAFHHVPNGDAIIKYISNDAQGFAETLDRETPTDRDRIAKAMAEGCRELYLASLESETFASYEKERVRILSAVPDDCPQAAVFMTLFDPYAVSKDVVDDFCTVITDTFSYPRNVLRCMLRNSQRDVLLTAQSLLRDGGLLVIADPDGNSDFNAANASQDPELTIANFTSGEELRTQLEEIGFGSIEVYRIVKNGNLLKVVPESRHKPWQGGHASRSPDLGYIVVAQRDQSREREISGLHRRGSEDGDPAQDLESEPEIRSLGELLRNGGEGTLRIIRSLFLPHDPVPHSGRVFRHRGPLRRKLQSLGWLNTLRGASVIAAKRIFVLSQGATIFIATDFRQTSYDSHGNATAVFPYSDEAQVLARKIRSHIENTPRKRERKVLDLCCGAGTLGILCAVLDPHSYVVCVDSKKRAIDQTLVNRALNGISPSRLHAETGNMWDFPAAGSGMKFHLAVADPPFSLRPPGVASSGHRGDESPEDGGEYGDRFTGEVLDGASAHLEQGGILLLLAYTLVGDDGKRIDLLYDHPGLKGRFEVMEQEYVWRYRHDKIAQNDLATGVPLPYLVIRLGDPTRLESIIFRSAQQQREAFQAYKKWLDGLSEDGWKGLQYVLGKFIRE